MNFGIPFSILEPWVCILESNSFAIERFITLDYTISILANTVDEIFGLIRLYDQL